MMDSYLNDSKEDMYRELLTAKKDWQMAQQQFEYAIEVEEIDIAIYKLKAAEKRYMYILGIVEQQVKKEKMLE